MKARVKVNMLFGDVRSLETVYRSLEPDNIRFPKKIIFHMKKSDMNLNFLVYSEEDLMALLSTIDDILESAQVSLNTITKLEC